MSEKTNPKLLIVDDEPTIVEYIQKIYERKGFLTFGTGDGQAAVEIFQSQRPQVNLIDIHMPFSPLDGIEVLQRIKEIDKNAVCIMISRITEKQKVEEAKKYGADAYLLKPFGLEELDRAITQIAKINLRN